MRKSWRYFADRHWVLTGALVVALLALLGLFVGLARPDSEAPFILRTALASIAVAGLTAVWIVLLRWRQGAVGDALMSAIPQTRQGVLLVREDGIIGFASDGARRMFSAAELSGRSLGHVVPKFSKGWWEDQLDSVDGEHTVMLDLPLLTLVGREFFGRAELGQVPWDGERWAFLIIRDVSERQQEQDLLQDALLQAREANRAKSAFLANMSHEIRTPLTAILGYADMLLRPGVLDQASGNLAAQVRTNAEHLLSVVNDILDLSRVEAGAVELAAEPTNLMSLISSVCSPMLPMARAQGLRFSASVGSQLPQRVLVDAQRLRQVLINLVSNAIKFTSEGYVEFYVTAEPADGARHLLRFAIIDSGVGIEQDDIEKLFNPFQRIRGAGIREIEGSGLGLSIAQRLSRLLGGEIEVTSEVGIGSVFTLVLPLERVGDAFVEPETSIPMAVVDQDEGEKELPSLAGARVLVVDDNPHNQEIERYFLEEVGAQVEVVSNGQKAIQRVVSGEPLDVVLLDMQMPDMDGFTVAGKLRELEVKTPLVAVTAYAMVGDREKCLAAGCDAYLSKPIHQPELIETVAKYVSISQRELTPPPVIKENKFLKLKMEYISRLPELIEQLREAFSKGQIDQLELHAHRLKGSAGSYGFDRLSHSAAAFEQFLGRDVAASEQELALNSLIHEIRMAVREGVGDEH